MKNLNDFNIDDMFNDNYCCPVKPGFRDFSSRNPSKYGT